jgi:hypothetical protein
MTRPVENITVRCRGCGHTYDTSRDLSVLDAPYRFNQDYVHEVTTARCTCGTVADFAHDQFTEDEKGVWHVV